MQPLSLVPSALRLACGLVALGVATTATVTYAAPIVRNGGARHWVAYNPVGRAIGPVQFLRLSMLIVNASTAPNAFTIFHEPAHAPICSGTLAPGESRFCGTQPTQHFEGGYFQVIAAEPVVVGGQSDVPTLGFEQNANGTFGATQTGTIMVVPFVWQEGCPPRKGSGCPSGITVNVGSGTGAGTLKPTN